MGRICKREGCYRHVYVGNERIHNYCGFKHAKEAAAAEGIKVKPHRKSPRERGSEETHSSPDSSDWDMEEEPSGAKEPRIIHRLLREDDLGQSGFEQKIPDLQLSKILEKVHKALSQETSIQMPWLYRAKPSISIYQGANIYEHHPWEILTEPSPRYFLSVTDQQKCSRLTKDGYTWKQSGPRHQSTISSTLIKKYFTYQKKSKGKKRGVVAKDDSLKKWVLHQYSLMEAEKGHGAKACPWRVVIYKIENKNPPEFDAYASDGLSATPTGCDSSSPQPAITKHVDSPNQQWDVLMDWIIHGLPEDIGDTEGAACPAPDAPLAGAPPSFDFLGETSLPCSLYLESSEHDVADCAV